MFFKLIEGDSKVLEGEIYEIIKQAILNRKIAPGVKLSEVELAESLNVSRTPIRSALKKLSYDRFVRIIPKRGAFVAKPTVKEVEDVFEMRMLIENFSVEKACEYDGDPFIVFEKMERIIEEEIAAYTTGNISNVLKPVEDIHIEIAKLSNNEILITQLQDLISLSNIYLSFYSEMSMDVPNSPDEHKEILGAIKNKNTKQAKYLMKKHLEGVFSRLNFKLLDDSSVNLKDVFKNVNDTDTTPL